MKRLTVIAEMIVAMSQAPTLEAVYREALDTILRVAGSTRASILLFDHEGVARFVAWRGVSDAYRAAVTGHSPWTAGQPASPPILVPDVRTDAHLAPYLPAITAEGIAAMAFFPLATGGGTIGKLMVYFDDAPHVLAEDVALLLQSIAAHAAFGIDRQRVLDMLRSERTLFAAGPMVVVRWENQPGWPLSYVSPNAEEKLGVTHDELRRGIAAVVHPDDAPRLATELDAHAIRGDASFEIEIRLRPGSGETRWVFAHVALERDAAGTCTQFLGYLSDSTERRREAEALRTAEARVRESQRLEALGVLAGGIAHDFNNLLIGVLGNASFALGILPAEGPAHDTVADIQIAARMAADLTRQLLAYSGKGRFVLERLDLSHLLKDSAHLLSAVISRKATVHRELAAELPAVEGDATQLRQVAMNLLTNASDALLDKPGQIHMSTGVEDVLGGRNVRAFPEGEVRAGRYVFLEVSDTGHGMDAGQIPRIFDPFYTTRFQGRGLGLAAVLGIVRGHGGAIVVDSAPGKGTRIRLLLPALAQSPSAPGAPPARPPLTVPEARSPTATAPHTPPPGAKTLLVVDDEPVVRRVAQRVLERAGYRVLVAENGREALRIVDAMPGTVDAVLLDLTMPELSGEETYDALRLRSPALPVVMTSGYSEDTSSHLSERGLAGFLEKPYSADDLIQAMEKALAK